MKIKLNEKYLSGLTANTELHAGGIFFCIIYRNCLLFTDNGTVILTKTIIDAFRPMDEQDVKHIENYKIEGKYFLNDRGYLVCDFKDLFITYTGLPTEKDSNIIPFCIYDRRLSKQWSEVFQLEKNNK